MSNVTLSVVVPSVDIIFEDDTAAVITAVDADTVLGVTPGAVGLDILAATTADEVLTIAGAVGPAQVESITRNQFSAHAMSPDPHQVYVKKTDVISSLPELPGSGRAAVAAHAMAVDPHPAYVMTADIPSLIDPVSSARQVLSAHAMAVNPYRQYPTIDQMQLADADTAGMIMAHATSRAAHPDRPTLDQSILQSAFFGG